MAHRQCVSMGLEDDRTKRLLSHSKWTNYTSLLPNCGNPAALQGFYTILSSFSFVCFCYIEHLGFNLFVVH